MLGCLSNPAVIKVAGGRQATYDLTSLHFIPVPACQASHSLPSQVNCPGGMVAVEGGRPSIHINYGWHWPSCKAERAL